MVNIGNQWDEILAGEFEKEYYQKLRRFLIAEYRSKTIYPDMHDIFNALKYTDYDDVKVVILGQDPYHGPGQAHGMSFSVRPGIKQPPSLVNIFKELKDDLGINPPDHGYLVKWAEQGGCCLIHVLPYVNISLIPIKERAGKYLPIRLSGFSTREKNLWCSFSGAVMQSQNKA